MMRHHFLVGACLSLAAACHAHDGEERSHSEADHGHGHNDEDERPALSYTHWTDQSELFVEFRALVVGQESAFAAHVTRLEPFAALARGSVSVVLRGPSGEERGESQAPSVPGIFRPVLKPAAAGPRRLVVEIEGEGLSASHDLGAVTVYENVAAARGALPEEQEVAGRIPFLKEQQWPIEFATAVVAERSLRPSLRAPGTIRARPDADVVIAAPAAGRVATGGRAFPKLGERVVVGDELARLTPRLEAADLASLELAVTSGELERRFAERERQRLERLRNEGAVPERRVEDAVHAAEEARAALEGAKRRLDQFRRVERTSGGGAGTVPLRAPLLGTVTAVHVAPGTFVEAGAALFRVTDLTQVWLDVRVPQVDLGKIAEARGVSFQGEGADRVVELPAEALVARGHALDPTTRTLPLSFAVDNAGGQFVLGEDCRAFLATGDERRAIAVPDSALIDDGGTFVVFVQVEGESFERRVLRLGVRDRGYVEVLSGVTSGEHVATRGAWALQLAASSGTIPAHGHSH